MTEVFEQAAPDPVLSRRIRVAEVVLTTVIGLAAATELVRLVTLGAPVGGYIAVAAAVAGTVAGLRYPAAGLGLVAAAPMLATLLGWDPLVTWTIAVFAAAILTLRGLSGTLTGAVVGVANFAAVGISHGTVALTDPAASVAAFAAVAAAAAGSSVRDHARYLAELHQRTHDAVATRRAAVDRGIAEERVRIARDLHDGLGHRIAVLNMRLGAAEVHLPPGAQASLGDIRAARADLQAVLAETQQILRVLRVADDKGDTMDDTMGDTAPAPALDRITELVAGFRETGLDIEATLGDLTLPVAPHVGAAAFRITQEVLTNAHRHGTGTVSLHVDTTGDEVVIEAVNVRAPADPATATRGDSFGLTGLRERVASAGGRVEVRPDDDLFTVRVVLPAGRPA